MLRLASLTPWCLSATRLAPPDLLGSCAGHVEAGQEPGSLCLLLAAAVAAALGSLRVVPVWGPTMGMSLAGASGVGLGLLVLRLFACVNPVTDASGFPYRPSFDGGPSWYTGAVSCGRRHRPLRVGGRHVRVSRACVCVCVPLLAASIGLASRPRFSAAHLFLWAVWVCSLFARPPLRWAPLVCGCCCVFSFFPFSLRVLVALGLGVLLSRPPSFLFSPPLSPILFLFYLCFLLVAFFFHFLFYFFRCVLSVRCGAGSYVLGCALCCAVLLWPFYPGRGRFVLALCRSVLPRCACSLCVVSCRVSRVPWRRAGAVSLPCAASGALFGCFVLLSCSAALAACRFPPVLWWGCPVAPGLVVLFRLALVCLVLVSLVLCLPRCGVPCGVVHPPRPPARCALFFSLGGCAGSAAPRLVLVPCVVRCRALCLVVLRCVVCCAFCLVLYGVLVLGRVLVPYCPERCCAGSCCAVSVVFCCCVLLSSLLVFLCVVPCLSVLPRAVSVSLVLCRVAFLCWFALRCAVWCSAVPWCLSWPCAVLFVLLRCSGSVLPCPLLWRIVVLCMSLGAVLCRRPMLPVFRVLSFLLPCFWAPLFSWRLLCGAVLVCPRRCSLSGALSPLCVWLLVVSGCLLLGLAVLRCLMVVPGVVFRWCCPCLAAWLVALWFVVVYLGAPLPCAVFCGAVLSCCAAVLCCSFASLHVPVFCFLRLRVASMQKPKINTPWEPDIQFLE